MNIFQFYVVTVFSSLVIATPVTAEDPFPTPGTLFLDILLELQVITTAPDEYGEDGWGEGTDPTIIEESTGPKPRMGGASGVGTFDVPLMWQVDSEYPWLWSDRDAKSQTRHSA